MLQLKLICVLVLTVTSVLGDDRLTCYELGKSGKQQLKTCTKGDTCTTIFDGETLVKGCSFDLKDECDHSKETCFECLSNKCNNATILTDYRECIACSSKAENCLLGSVTETKKCQSCMARLVVDEITKSYEMIRSCLDDIEESKQEECISGTDTRCTACKTDRCNKNSLKESLPLCFKCNDPTKCNSAPSTTACTKFDDNSCYAIFDKSASISSLGCLSSLEPSDVQKLKDENKIITCEGLLCNDYDKIQKKEQCSLCDSKTDSKCAQNPEEMTSTAVCDIVDNNLACFTKISADKSTSRGCWKNLPKAEQSQCKGEDENESCSGCIGSNCNNKIFPANRKICHICDSSQDPSCASTKPNKALACLLYDKDDQCVSKLENKVTYRGCTSNFDYTCTGSDRTCRKCNMNKCNIIDLEHMIDDSSNNGMWHDLPLTCLSCDGDNCKYENTTETAKCEETQEDCMTVFNNEDVVIMRGCENEVYESYEIFCIQNPNLCFNCKSNNCNIATTVKDHIKCIYCGWPNSPSCIDLDTNNLNNYAQRQCYKSCMTALYPHSEFHDSYDLIRTCIDDKLIEQQKNCSTTNDENNLNPLCLRCEGENCNKEFYPKNRTNCYMCNGEDNCKTPILKSCPLYRDNDDCHYIYNEDQVVRESGCSSSLPKKTIDELLNNNKIGLCNGKDCNSFEKQPKDNKCVICDSKTDVDCATNPNLITKETECKAPISSCFMRVNEDGITERGCLLSLQDKISICNSTSDSFCKSCNEVENCNKEIFPQNRQLCQVCSSKIDASCHNKPNSTQVCPLYFPDEKCVSTYKNKITERGCGQTLKCENEKNKKTCDICDTNNCNTVDLKKKNGSGVIIGNSMIISLLSFGLIIFFK